jgi:hypothetical protein
MILTFITVTVMALRFRQWKTLTGLAVAFGVWMMIDIPPTLQVMLVGGLVATWHSLFINGVRHEKINTHH